MIGIVMIGIAVALAFLAGVIARDAVTPTAARWNRDGRALARAGAGDRALAREALALDRKAAREALATVARVARQRATAARKAAREAAALARRENARAWGAVARRARR